MSPDGRGASPAAGGGVRDAPAERLPDVGALSRREIRIAIEQALQFENLLGLALAALEPQGLEDAGQRVGERLAFAEDWDHCPAPCVHEARLSHQEGVKAVEIELRTRRQVDEGPLLGRNLLLAPEVADELRSPAHQGPSGGRPTVDRLETANRAFRALRPCRERRSCSITSPILSCTKAAQKAQIFCMTAT